MTGKHKSVTVHNLYACGYSGLTYPHSADARAGKTALAGAAYKDHPATVRHTCSSTTEALRRVTRWRLSPSGLPVRNGTYGAGELDCDVTTDGDGRQTLLFTDAAGRTVLQRSVADGGEYADTYYITDSWGNPLMVIPPEATKALAGAGSAAQDADIVDNYCYTYSYDSQLRVISKKLPGAGEHVFAYDSEGRQAFSRDGNQYGRGRRAFALYDALGRVAVTGTCQDAADEEWWSQPSSSRPAMTARRSGQASAVNRWGVACGYDWDVELTNVEILTVSYYDDYGFAMDNSAMITLPQGAKASPKGLATGTLTALLGNGGGRATSDDGISGYLLSTNFYDTEERLIETRTQTPGGGLLTATTAYTAGGVPVQTRTQLAQGDTQLTYTNDITVDRHGRPVTSVLTRGDSGPSWTLAACTYDGIGRLSSVIAGGTLTRTLSYDIHGWQTGWETPYLSETLHYGESGPSGTTPSYTGLITAKEMLTKMAGGIKLSLPDTYVYSYDRLGRLTAAKYSSAGRGVDFSTTYAYDLQGNMLRLTRKGLTGPRNYGLIDDVTATYTGNQLHTLCDDAPEVLLEASMDVAAGTYSSDAFGYDANGNLTRDLSRDITDQEYNALNLPQRITFADGSRIDWLYTASSEKLRQTVIAASGDTIARRDYLGPYLFVNNKLDRYETAEGYITPDDDFHAYIPDYQGNIVGVYNTSPNAITFIDSPLDQHTRYYPYGLPFADASNPTANRRKYGAKELTPDLGLNAYDFEARTLTPAFPAFAQPDPLAEKYYALSPYLYCAGNPIIFVDPSGCDWLLSTGNRVYWYSGNYGDKSHLLRTYRATSGSKTKVNPNSSKTGNNYQNSRYQHVRNLGPTVEGKYKLNLMPEPEVARVRNNLVESGRGKGIQSLKNMPDENGNPRNSSDWGDNRISMIPINVSQPTDDNGRPGNRDLGSFYIHDSTKGETHGCIEIETRFFVDLIIYKNEGNKIMYILVSYPNSNHNTNGGTEIAK